MGGCSFRDEVRIPKGARRNKDFVWKQFKRLQDEAEWEYGHGGYTGTIAEKGGVSIFYLPKLNDKKLGYLENMLWDCDWNRDDKRWVMSPTDIACPRKGCDWKTREGCYKCKGKGRVTMTSKAMKELLGYAGIDDGQFNRMAELIQDKWGNALALVGKTSLIFTGMASS